MIFVGVIIQNSYRTFSLRFTDVGAMSEWLADYRRVLEGNSELQLRHSNDLFRYLLKVIGVVWNVEQQQHGKEQIKQRRMRQLDAEAEKLKAKLARIAKEK